MTKRSLYSILVAGTALLAWSCNPKTPNLTPIAKSTIDNSATLEVIFYGLIGLVPDRNYRDLIALLLDGSSSGVEEHVPALYLDQGICSGCKNLPDSPSNFLFGARSIHGWDLWFPDLEKEGSPLRSGRPPRQFPTQLVDLTSPLWMPQMSLISPQVGTVRAGCLEGKPSNCGVAARFRLAGWGQADVQDSGVEACHFVHGSDRVVDAFLFAPRGEPVGTASLNAVADASKFSIRFQGPELRLALRRFGQQVQYATLMPAQGIIRLVVWNQPKVPHCEGHPRMPHFEAYYKLTAGRTTRISVPRGPHVTPGKILGSCEDLLTTIDPSECKEPAVSYPHNIRECDSMLYGATPLTPW